MTSENKIGRLHTYTPLDGGKVELDVASVSLDSKWQHSGNTVPHIDGAKFPGRKIGLVVDRKDIYAMKTVAKVGRSSGYTEGTLTAGLFRDVGIEVPGQGLVYYDNVFDIQSKAPDVPFAKPGDSGAAVFGTKSHLAFGLVVGGGLSDDVWKDAQCMLVYACDLGAGLKAVKAEWL